ncbi:pyridoxamine 5'-phosphate oxidase family protein [Oceanispirochaeta crateris]|jgi:predicted pyridoxine 5'-phosphate oxidase superfamily flavin-nucleotide-binding protein|nr:pyridoxamine 5'-phosphate oxidase family protein [Oceanispirochaeta crateris]
MKMAKEVMTLLNDKESTKVLTSLSADGIPHTVVIGSTMAPQSDLLCAAEVLMQKTSSNLKENKQVSILTVKGKDSYQVKAVVKEYLQDGPLFAKVKQELANKGMPCKGIWTFEPTEAYDQSAGPNAGQQIV